MAHNVSKDDEGCVVPTTLKIAHGYGKASVKYQMDSRRDSAAKEHSIGEVRTTKRVNRRLSSLSLSSLNHVIEGEASGTEANKGRSYSYSESASRCRIREEVPQKRQ